MPIRAYLAHVKNPVSVIFPANSSEGFSNKTPQPGAIRDGWDSALLIGNSHVISVPASIIQGFELNDVIDGFN